MIPATGGDTLRRNFQQIQEGRVAAQNLELQQQQQAQQHAPQPNRNQKQVQQPSRDKPPTEEPPRPALPQRLIVVPDPHQQAAQPQQMPIQHAANRPLPPTPRSSNGSSGSSSQAQQQQPQRNSQQFKPMVDKPVVLALSLHMSLTTLFVGCCSGVHESLTPNSFLFHISIRTRISLALLSLQLYHTVFI